MGKYAERARGLGGKVMGGFKGSAIALGTGAVAGLVGGMLTEHTDFFQKYWYSLPIAIGLGGHVIKQTVSRDAGSAALGSAGTMAYYNYKLHKASVDASGGAAPAGTSGVQGPVEDYVQQLRSLPDTAGTQSPMSTSGRSVAGMRAAA
jgi:hypothetical protein